jgi:hypothetical protein
LLPLFALALFVGAALLFVIQPMVAKMALPLFGGAPAVWNTCVLFFQAALLTGYAYAHWAPRRFGLRFHTILHPCLLVFAALLLPFSISESWIPADYFPPALWLLWLLTVTVGLPFVLLSATAPLLQRWFATSGHVAAADPYFLYTASNFGSMIALLGYPFIVEPILTIDQQSRGWLIGYLGLIVLLLGCAVLSWRSLASSASVTLAGRASEDSQARSASKETQPASVAWPQRLRWLALAFVPSSMMLSVTMYLTTDIAAFPLLWVLPLALYLMTFILAFARKPPIPHRLVQRLLPLVVIILTLVLLSGATTAKWLGIWPLLIIHLFGLMVVALACHGELARARPDPTHLTDFYLWLSLGGVLGGMFNALLAPVLFTGVAEYPIVLILACLLSISVPSNDVTAKKEKDNGKQNANQKSGKRSTRAAARPPAVVGRKLSGRAPPWLQNLLRRDIVPVVLLGVFALCLVLFGRWYLKPNDEESFQLMVGLAFGMPLVIVYTYHERPLRFGLGIGALFVAGLFTQGIHGETLLAQRSFFGIHRVTRDQTGQFVRLIHGNTIHGQQSKNFPGEPLTYYYRNGPIGRAIEALERGGHSLRHVGLVGLGVGSLAAYAQTGQSWTFYEIDPLVVDIARNSGYFTYWKDAEYRDAELSVVLGDARLQLEKAEGTKYQLLVIDAFTSDAVPVHLLTREALQVYLSRLTDDGVLAFHVSNRYLNLQPVLAALAADAGLHGYSWLAKPTPVEEKDGKFLAHWIVMGKSSAALDAIRKSGPWHELGGGDSRYLWTDQFSNIVNVIRWSDVN